MYLFNLIVFLAVILIRISAKDVDSKVIVPDMEQHNNSELKLRRNVTNETDEYYEIALDELENDQTAYTLHGFMFIFVAICVGAIVRSIMLVTTMCLPYRVVMLALGAIVGCLNDQYPDIKPYISICHTQPDTLLLVVLPILVFNTAYNVDSHSLWKYSPVILLTALGGVMATALAAGSMAYYLFESSWSFTTAILFGFACAPIYPPEIVSHLQGLSRGRHVALILEGEWLFGDASAMIAFNAVYGILAGATTEPEQVVILVARFLFGGIALGAVCGWLTVCAFSVTYNDLRGTVSVTIVCAFLTYYLGEKVFYVSGLIAVIIAGVIVSGKRSVVANEVEAIVCQFWDALAYTANVVLFAMMGIAIFQLTSQNVTMQQLFLIFVTYTTVFGARLCLYAAISPLLHGKSPGAAHRTSLAAAWGGLRGPLSLCMALIVFDAVGEKKSGEIFVIQVTGIVFLSLLINATTMPKLLKLLGLGEISLAKKANMTNCVRRVMVKRDMCITMLKMDKFLADANWDFVENGTNIKHPYKIQYSAEEEDEDETYMGYRYTTCPECDKEIPNEPTKKEYNEMMREANQRVLKALKISYWRQYEHGKLSKVGARALVQAVEQAADSDWGRVNLDILGALWKPKAHAIWLRNRVVASMALPGGGAPVPGRRWRRICHRIATSWWFELVVYIVIVCNTPVILCEVLLKPPIPSFAMSTIKILNVLFFAIYIVEMWIKMEAFGVGGYFASHWNKLDFFIILMATGDLIMDILDSVGNIDKWSSTNSTYLTATKLLRMLRFVRLVKLARAFGPRVLARLDRLIDIQLAFGYDVGKGFVTGHEEVCKVLPLLVDNMQIQELLRAKLETERLTVMRQLGLLQRDRPWTAITVKTRQATRSTLNHMLIDAGQLKEEGFLDEVEYRLLVNAVNEKVIQCRHKDDLVAPSSPETQLRAVSWLQDNERVADFILEHAEIVNLNCNDIIITRGDTPEDIYIIVAGLLQTEYTPPVVEPDEAIPNNDYMTSLNMHEPSQDYIVSGNAIGVLGVLTNRPYDYTVSCESAVQAYRIQAATVREAFNLSPHPIMGLEASMWRAMGVKMALLLLPRVPAYSSYSLERLTMRMEHAFVPCLTAFKVFVVNELMEDVILLDGVCQDFNTREVFQPICYIPRTAHKLIFPASSQLFVSSACPETRLFIIPAKDAEEVDVMTDAADELQCELVSNASSRCLYHRAAHILSGDSRLGGQGVRRGRKRRRQRRVNYRESQWSKVQNTASTFSSEQELSSKYYKRRSFATVTSSKGSLKPSRQSEQGKSKSAMSPGSSLHGAKFLEAEKPSEQELYSTSLSKDKNKSK